MDRRTFLGLSTAGTAGLLAGGCSGSGQGTPPNVVLIISDDQSWRDFGFMGHEYVQTPHLDELAAGSAVFPNGYVPTSLCRASLATLLTGLYASQHKICCNDPPEGIDRRAMLPFMQDAPALPRLLREAGYLSLQTGKFWEGHYKNAGFTHGMTTEGRHGGSGLRIGRETMQPIYDFVKEAGDRPYFVYYAPFMPHTPHTPPEELLADYAVDGTPEPIAKYWAMIEWFDRTVGDLMSFINLRGDKENTLVLFVVDNGWLQPTEPTSLTRGAFAPRSKLSPYENGVRTPVMVRWPGRVTPGYDRRLVSTIDIVPTVLRAAGLSPTADMPGTGLVDMYQGRTDSRGTVFGEIYTHDAQSLEEIGPNVTHQWLRHRDWKLIQPVQPEIAANRSMRSDRIELFHLGQDPGEEHNLAPRRPEVVDELTGLLREWEHKSADVAA